MSDKRKIFTYRASPKDYLKAFRIAQKKGLKLALEIEKFIIQFSKQKA